jgi:outer membrane protein assembly factor BamB
LWETVIQTGPFATIHPKNSHASPTPACDGSLVFIPFIDPQQLYVAALSLDGDVVWKQSVGPFNSEHGYGSSPVLHESLVIVNGDSKGSAYVAALNRQTGEIAWRTPREPSDENGSYATPIVVNLEGRPQLLLAGFDHVTSYDPLTGQQIWSVDGPTRVMANTLVVQEPFIVASGGWPELEILCIRADGSSKSEHRDIVWRSKKNVAYVPTPIVHDQSVLILAGNGTCADFDLHSGSLNWQERLGGEYSASIVRVGDLYLVPNEAGETTVFRLTPKLERVAKNRLADAGGMASPTICDGKILLRTDHHLYCIGEK